DGAGVAVVDDLDHRLRLVEDPLDLRGAERGGAAVDVGGDVGTHRQHVVGADDSASGYRGAAGVHDDLHPVALRPPHHRLGLLGVFHAGDADLAHDADTGGGHLGEVGFDEPFL